jgi:uncharacterized membrane protein YhaH (DUF805 family)
LLLPLLDLSGTPDSPSVLDQVLTWVSIVVALIYIVVLGFIRGTTGPNAYGDDPLTKTATSAATA